MSTGQGMLSGAAQGATAGAAFGPWGAAIGGAVGLLGGFLGSKSAKRAAEQQARATAAQAGAFDNQGRLVQGAYNQFGQNMFDLAGGVDERFQFNPIAARGPFGGMSMQDGTLVNDIGPAGNMLVQGGQDALSQAMSFDRQGAQADYFNNLQAMYGSARQNQMQGLMRQLQAKGMAGLGSNVNGNMLMKGLASGWQDQDLAASKMAMDYGGAELDRSFQRGYGMLSAAQAMSNYNLNQWNTGQSQASPFQLGALGQYYGLMQKGYGADVEGVTQAAPYFTNAATLRAGGQISQAAQRDAANKGMIGGVMEGVKSIPWGMLMNRGGSTPPLNQPISGNSWNNNMSYAPAYGGYASPF